MTDYQSNYTGSQIDTGIALANTAIQDISGKQDTLVSGTTIKTINNESLLGEGNITISGGSGTDVQINNTSITSGGVADIITESAYNASTNKIATMSDMPSANYADTDLSNLTDAGKILFSGEMMPSDKYDTLTIGATGTEYTAPSNGWYYFATQPFSSQMLQQQYYFMICSGVATSASNFYQGQNELIGLILPALKGSKMKLYYAYTQGAVLRFIYAKGSESEYIGT